MCASSCRSVWPRRTRSPRSRISRVRARSGSCAPNGRPGSLAAYARFEGYVPRPEAPSFTAGGKIANFDRIEWNIITDPATSAAAMQRGEADWWQHPDRGPAAASCGGRKGVKIVPMTRFGSVEILRFNELFAPFDNVKMRQAMLHVVSQQDYMQAAYRRRHQPVQDGGGRVHAGFAGRDRPGHGGAEREARFRGWRRGWWRRRATRARRSRSWRPRTIRSWRRFAR